MTERLTEEALLLCPGCKDEAAYIGDKESGWVQCTSCFFRTAHVARASAIAAWNRRATPVDDLSAENERLKADLAVAEAAMAAHKSRGDNHWETMRCLYRIATEEGDMQAIIQHIRDAGHGYTERPEETLRRYQTELAVALADLAEARAALSQPADELRAATKTTIAHRMAEELARLGIEHSPVDVLAHALDTALSKNGGA